MSTEQLLNERGQTHGDYEKSAFASQTIKQVLYSVQTEFGQGELTDSMRQAIDMIASKLGRIAAGDCSVRDHWEDIAGYATLAARECPGQSPENTILFATGVPKDILDILVVALQSKYSVPGSAIRAVPRPGIEPDVFCQYDIMAVAIPEPTTTKGLGKCPA